MLYVSETVEDVLHESQEAWKGQFFYDILHPKDIQKVKSQLDCMNIEESKCLKCTHTHTHTHTTCL